MSRDNKDLVVGLDIGTSKIVALVAEINQEGNLNVIGMGSQDSRAPRRAFTSVGQRTYRAHIAAHGMGDLSATYAEQAKASPRAGHCSRPPSTAPWLSASAPIWGTHRRLALAP